jgi:hypothetical protein
MTPWATHPEPSVVIVEGALQLIETSTGVTRGHCARCGSSITYQHVARPGAIDITLASLGDPPDVKPTAHIWVEDKISWLVINDGLPQYAKTVVGDA